MDIVSTGSAATVSNLGIGAALVTVPETRTYRTADERQSTFYRAGDQISRAEAERYGIVDPVAVAVAGDDAFHGARIAAYLQAAGFSVAKAEELIEGEEATIDLEGPEFGETVAAALRAAGYELPKGRDTIVGGERVPVAEVELPTLVASEVTSGQPVAHVQTPAPGEAKQEPAPPANKAEDAPSNKSQSKPPTKKG